MLNEGIFDMQKFVDGGWVTALKYEDEVLDDLKKKTGGKADKLRSVSLALLLFQLSIVDAASCKRYRLAHALHCCAPTTANAACMLSMLNADGHC